MALARVSSREQEREGFSLEVQIDGFNSFSKKHKGVADPIFRIAETATKSQQRSIFREAIAFAKKHSAEYSGFLFYKFDRATRNMKDLILLEEIEEKYGLPIISITQPVENTPTGRMIRRTLATIGAFQTEQQSLDIREGLAKRVSYGWFPSRCPFGYRNLRHDDRAIAEVHAENARKVQRAFYLRAYEGLLIEQIIDRMYEEGHYYADSKPRFSTSKMNAILSDRSYLGLVKYKGEWHPGRHVPLIDKTTWDLVRVSFGEQRFRSHQLIYGSEVIRCGYCGRPVTGEEKEKMTKAGIKNYIYYRCACYHKSGHPRDRLRETEIEAQVEPMLKSFRIKNVEVAEWAIMVATHRLRHEQADCEFRAEELKRQLSLVDAHRDELLNLRLAKDISDEKYAAKQIELSDRESLLGRQVESMEAQRGEIEQLAKQAPEVFQRVDQNWSTMDRGSKHRILKLLFGGFILEGTTLVPDNETPLGLFRAEG